MKLVLTELETVAPDQSAALFQLFQLYYYENSDWAAEDVGEDGLFDACAAAIADYVNNPAKGAYWIRKNGALAGFVVTEPATLPGGERAEELADLFILKRYRRQGLALASVRELAQKFKGPWIVAVYHDDTRAAAFWRKAFASLALPSVRQYEDPALQQFKLFAINEL
jgi:predicted acetyltransferase